MNWNVNSVTGSLLVGLLSNAVASDDTVGNILGDVFRDKPECPEMVVVPPGSFRMGDIAGGGSSNERPVHQSDDGSITRAPVGSYQPNEFEIENRSNNFGFRLARPLSLQSVLRPDLEISTD